MRFAILLSLLCSTVACDLLLPPPPASDERRRRADDDDDDDEPAACVDNGDCRGGEVCEDDRCVAICEDDGDCPENADICSGAGRCVECIDDGDCRGDDVCSAGRCDNVGVGEGEGEGEGEGPVGDVVCDARVVAVNGAAAPGQTIINSGDVLTLSSAASRSTRQGGSIVASAWQVLSSPNGGAANLSRPDGPSTDCTVSGDGLFVLSLRVTDDLGASASCELSITSQAPASPTDVLVQLTWDSADGDLDLHLNRASPANWCAAADDCYYGARATSWGASLDIDDLNGFGPENLSLRGAADGTYTVGVGVFSSSAPTTATLKVFIGGSLEFEDSQVMSEGPEWVPATIVVSGGAPSVRSLGTLAEQAGSCWGTASPAPQPPPEPGNGDFGQSCGDGNDCNAPLICGILGTCSEVCEQASDCSRCEAVHGAGACSCSPFSFCTAD